MRQGCRRIGVRPRETNIVDFFVLVLSGGEIGSRDSDKSFPGRGFDQRGVYQSVVGRGGGGHSRR